MSISVPRMRTEDVCTRPPMLVKQLSLSLYLCVYIYIYIYTDIHTCLIYNIHAKISSTYIPVHADLIVDSLLTMRLPKTVGFRNSRAPQTSKTRRHKSQMPRLRTSGQRKEAYPRGGRGSGRWCASCAAASTVSGLLHVPTYK